MLSPPEYVEHLKDEAQVCAIIERVQRYLEEKGTTEEICRIYLRRVLHTYYKFDYKAHQRQLTPPEGSSKVSGGWRFREWGSSAHSPYLSRACHRTVLKSREGTQGQMGVGPSLTCDRLRLREQKPECPLQPPFPLQSEQDQAENEGEDSAVLMERLCKYIYAKDRTDRIRTCAILCHIYHHALHSRWYQARDLMLMSHLQDNIQHADPPVQVS